MKAIPLTKGQVAWVDDEDYDRLIQYKWYAMYHKQTNGFYARTSVMVGKTMRFIYMHRAVLRAGNSVQVDHENHDTLLNIKSNLRITTNAGNGKNVRLMKTNTSGFCGVYQRNGSKRWSARITVAGERKELGSFADKRDAIIARASANILYGFHTNHGKAIDPHKKEPPPFNR